jgi:hypothetical protein
VTSTKYIFDTVRRVGRQNEEGTLVVARDGLGFCSVEAKSLNLHFFHTWTTIKAFVTGENASADYDATSAGWVYDCDGADVIMVFRFQNADATAQFRNKIEVAKVVLCVSVFSSQSFVIVTYQW